MPLKHDYAKFIAAWQTSASRAEVAKKLNLSLSQIANVRNYLIKHKIHLKKMRRQPPEMDYKKLAKLAARLKPPSIFP